MRKGIAVALLMTAAAIAVAEGGERVPPVTDPVVKKECGSCHMVFPPQFLPRRSWQKLADTLADHFGENAGLGEAQRKAVPTISSPMPRMARRRAARGKSLARASPRRRRRSASRRRLGG